MHDASAVLTCLMALPIVLAFQMVSDGHRWHRVARGIDPDRIHRHVYYLSEWCPSEPRVMRFGDEVIVESQRPWIQIYKANVTCSMTLKGHDQDVGILVNVINEDTLDCEDYLRITQSFPVSNLYCGPQKNVTGKTENHMNETIQLDWHTAQRNHEGKQASGIRVLFTAFQENCKPDQTCFPCTNRRIIDKVHTCNGVDNCGDNSDEDNCRAEALPVYQSSWPLYVMIFMFVCSLAALAGLSLVAFRFYNERNLGRQTRPVESRNVVVEEREKFQP